MRYLKRTRSNRKRNWLLLLALTSLLLTGLSLDQGVSAAQAGQAAPTESPYIEAVLGTLPLIIGIPHGGSLAPGSIPDRQQAVLVNDPNSQAAGRALAAALAEITGQRPTLIINQLDRSKLDPVRGLAQGAQGDPVAESAWWSFHENIETAANTVAAGCSRGLYLEWHSFGGEPSLIQIGYGLDEAALAEEDEVLSKRRFVFQSNIRSLVTSTHNELADLIRGPSSLGGLLQAQGYGTVPSPNHPIAFEGYFDGGYSVYRHGSRYQGVIDALQVEVPYRLLSSESNSDFIRTFAGSLVTYMETHYQWSQSADGRYDCAVFADVSDSHWASDAIQAQFEAGNIQACSSAPRSFCPDDDISRQEAADWLWRAFGSDRTFDMGSAVFADIPYNATTAQELWEEGIVGACSTEPLRFCPQAELNRAELARWLLKAKFGAGVVPASPTGTFADIVKADWDSWWVEQAYHQGMLRPCAASVQSLWLCPQKTVSRAEWAWALNRAIDQP